MHLSLPERSPFFVYFGFLCLQDSSVPGLIPTLTQGVKGLGSLVQLCCGEGGVLQKQMLLVRSAGSAHSGWITLDFPQSTACTSQLHITQAPRCSASALSQVGRGFRALPRSKLLRFSGAPQGHRPRLVVHFLLPRSKQVRPLGAWRVCCPKWAVHFMYLPSPSCLVSQVHRESIVSGKLCVFSAWLISDCHMPGKCEPSRIPGRHG